MSMERPIIAASADDTPICAPKIHSTTVTPNPAHIRDSAEDGGPISSNAFCAATGASGVSFNSGGSSAYITMGVTRMERMHARTTMRTTP